MKAGRVRSAKIAIEEHFAVPDAVETVAKFYPPELWPKLRRSLLGTQGHLLAEMDLGSIERAVLSLSSPGIQAVATRAQAIEIARRANDYLAEQIALRPDRFLGWAALPLQDAEAATQEAIRCIRELGFKGVLVNGFSQVDKEDSSYYYDLPQYEPFWAALEKLDVPFYLHPRYPVEERSDLAGHPWLKGSAWSFGVETATHALRLMASGLFDRHPRLTVILGHLGEMLPNAIWRIDHRIGNFPRGIPAKKKMAEYLRNNFYLATSGNFSTSTLVDAMLCVGADRILFAVDYPFERISEAAEWFDGLEGISEADWQKIARGNAEKLLKVAPAERNCTPCPSPGV